MIHPSGGQYLGAGAMAMLVHGLFLLGLVFSVTWRSLPELPVYADLWAELPPLPEAPEPPPPQPVETVAPPEPLPAPPALEPQADIQLEAGKEEERRRLQVEERERVRIEAEQRRVREAERRQRERQEAEARRQEAERQRQEEEARRQAQERARRELDEALARQLQEDLAGEARLLKRRAGSQAEAAARLKMIEDYRDRIRNKIHGYLRLPPNLSGNPEVVYQVRLLPDGEVLRLMLLKSSGQPAYDRQVELAILKASPLPLPPDRELAGAFREDLILKFRPYDEEGAGA